MPRFAAKLLFQFRVRVGDEDGKRRTCEERIINFEARSPKGALAHAKRYGKKAAYEHTNAEGHPVHFEFVGVMDLLHLGLETEAEEVWYDIRDRIEPMERRDRLIPTDDALLRGNAVK